MAAEWSILEPFVITTNAHVAKEFIEGHRIGAADGLTGRLRLNLPEFSGLAVFANNKGRRFAIAHCRHGLAKFYSSRNCRLCCKMNTPRLKRARIIASHTSFSMHRLEF